MGTMTPLFRDFFRKDRPWMVICGGLLLYTFYDIYDHISRPGSTFVANPVMWIVFSLVSLITIIVLMFLVSRLLDLVFNGYQVVKEVLGLFVAISFHILISGPVYNALFWPADQLMFSFNIPAILMLCGIYFFFRIAVFNGVRYFMKRKKGIAG
ncbi:hypothetical protein [Robertkochia sediminum]|uniref:hypothetical protein n=1 Tax=Robertkochia sediminum TaxID=2785326 RepID=UPI001931E03D|nr:hypothetical protein [Robertkochia sediminum]MBL7473074.1 hypothetical protein [Robertkochia sediminum]